MPTNLTNLEVGKLLSSGLDYLRVTVGQGDQGVTELREFVEEQLFLWEAEGHKMQEFGGEGFNGYRCGPWRWGVRDGLWLFEASGPSSEALYDGIRAANCPVKCTRIDVQCTSQRQTLGERWANSIELLVRYAERLAGRKRAVRSTIEFNKAGGHSLGLYSRASRRYLRLYDKGKQSHEGWPVGSMRAEMEYKREMARVMFEKLLRVDDLRAFAVSVLTSEFWRLGLDARYAQETPIQEFLAPKVRTPDEVRAGWFARSVVPAVARMDAKEYKVLCVDRLRHALAHYLQPNAPKVALNP